MAHSVEAPRVGDDPTAEEVAAAVHKHIVLLLEETRGDAEFDEDLKWSLVASRGRICVKRGRRRFYITVSAKEA